MFYKILLVLDIVSLFLLLGTYVLYFFGVQPVYSFMNKSRSIIEEVRLVSVQVLGVIGSIAGIVHLCGLEVTNDGVEVVLLGFVFQMALAGVWFFGYVMYLFVMVCNKIGSFHEQIIAKRGLK